MFHANFLGRIVGRLASVPVVITSRRNVDIGGDLRELLNRWTSSLDDAVVAVCESARELEIERSRVVPDKVITIYNGVAVARFAVSNRRAAAHVRETFGIPLEAPLLGSVCRLHLQKGYADLLTALTRVQARVPAVRLLLVGEGELRSQLEAQAQAMGLSEAVIFAGARTDVPEILAGLDVFVLPSLWEGMSNAVLEAMAAGLPVVATGVGGTPEVVVDGVTGLLVAAGDAGALARSLTRLLCDPELRRRMGQAGRERVAQRFTVGRMVEQTQRLYERLLRGKGIIPDSGAPIR
jgi:glycosyltransferase involved in cell wall biosynthesis